ncbi:S-adenosyl-L-methionine-dependent methyltransferase [Lasiosphaeris hirsuta]|uniref:S-adenosyl-L-methionine-dependent methyltransferase n=1 Tax=Lasiosphaeris hirsuta TaxID=260670 RepID=A0AA40DXV8_9PEZI|nr:S-adenosyl-L-methionine-dependent methyltransferase [Lasiosphaeris hirsuta]
MDYDCVLDTILDSGYLPHTVIRMGIRHQVRGRVAEIASPDLSEALARKMAFVEELKGLSIAVETAAANKQHYEVGVGVLQAALGPRMKYSSCTFPTGRETLGEAEVLTLQNYIDKGEIRDGMKVLDLGCGWGSASLYFAEKLPSSKIVGFSNSKKQKAFIDGQAKEKGLSNLEIITGDVSTYEFDYESFDRVVSIEMFEHMKNYEALLAKLARALKPGGKALIHHFAHKDIPYHFEEGWMTTHFFSGGTMPSADLLLYFQGDLKVQKQWWVNGCHYSKTLEAWLSKFIVNKKLAWPHLVETYGEKNAYTWYNRWQIFYMACSELFALDGGDTFGVCHYLFEKPLL